MKTFALVLASLSLTTTAAFAGDFGFTCAAQMDDGTFYDVHSDGELVTFNKLAPKNDGYALVEGAIMPVSESTLDNNNYVVTGVEDLGVQRNDIVVTVQGGYVGYLGHLRSAQIKLTRTIFNSYTGIPAIKDTVVTAGCLLKPLAQ